ncbi:MAG TPA: efflux RND transporter periplasmic adaptor subunit [Fimbriiglobus sp.]|jgi:cobalt-zinc-cadmium efflux system membrane fusion protein
MDSLDREPRQGFIRTVVGAIPTILVLGAIGAVGWWGHTHNWAVPKFSTLTDGPTAADDWCREHNVPESVCVECNPDVMPAAKPRGWCRVHGVPECVLCLPELAQLSVVASVTQADLARAKRSLEFTPRSENIKACTTHLRRIQFASDEAANNAGVAVTEVGWGPAVEFVAGPGEVEFDQTRVAHLSSRAPGTVWRVFKHLGDPVAAGELVALVDAAEVGKAKAELLQAFALQSLREKTLQRMRSAGAAESPLRIEEGEASLREAQIRRSAARQMLVNLGLLLEAADLEKRNADQLESELQFLGLPATLTKSLDPRTTTSNLLPIVSPTDGIVVSRDVVAGEVVDLARILFEVVDPQYLWLTLDLKGEDARRVKTGQPVRFRPDAGGAELLGAIAWISPQADPKTRTVKVRADVPNPTGAYRANSFGTGRVILRDEPHVLSVPSEAVQWEGCCHVVFVRDKDYLKPGSPKVFHVRKVRVGAKNDATVEIPVGLLPGEVIVTRGSGLLLTELKRNELGEGCACHGKK